MSEQNNDYPALVSQWRWAVVKAVLYGVGAFLAFLAIHFVQLAGLMGLFLASMFGDKPLMEFYMLFIEVGPVVAFLVAGLSAIGCFIHIRRAWRINNQCNLLLSQLIRKNQ